MALVAVLSALRQLILDQLSLPKEQVARQELYRKIFKNLSSEEILDLSKIDPQRLSIYTRSIFAGQEDLIRSRAPISWFLLVSAWKRKFNTTFARSEFPQKLHLARPWQSSTTEGLIRNFFDYITQDLDIFEGWQQLVIEVADYEWRTFMIKRWPDQNDWQTVVMQDLVAVKIERLLDMDFRVPQLLQTAAYNYDLIKLKSNFAEIVRSAAQGFDAEDYFCPDKIYLLGARNVDNAVCWERVTLNVYNFLVQQTAKRKFQLGEFAESFVASLQADLSEHDKFEKFIRLFGSLINAGVLTSCCVSKSESVVAA